MRPVAFYIIALMQLNFFFSNAQTASIVWEHSFGSSQDDEARCMIPTRDGCYMLAGYAGAQDNDVTRCQGKFDYWLVKIDGNGNMKWQKTYGGSKKDIARCIYQTNDGGYVVAGQSQSNDGDVTGNHGDYDFWIIKIDATGNLQWQKSYGGSAEENAYSVEQTNDGGFIVAGYTYSNNNGDINGFHGTEDMWVIKLDVNGILQWQKTYGGSDREEAASIHQTKDGGYIVSAWTKSNDGDVTGNHGDFDFWVVKLDVAGNIQWQKTFGGSLEDGARDAQQTSDGGYIVVGYVFSNDFDVLNENHGSRDFWLVKLDATGNITWQKTYGGRKDDYAYSIQQASDGGYLLCGYSTSNNADVSGNHGSYDYWSIKVDNAGTLVWQKTSGGGGDDRGRNILATTDVGYVISGYAKSNDKEVTGNHGDYDMWVEKFTFNQNFSINP